MTSWVSRIALLFLGLLSTAQVCPAIAAARLERIPDRIVDVKQLNKHLLPIPITPETNPKQLFVLRSPGSPDLTVIPVYFGDARLLRPTDQCGVYLLAKDGTQTFVATVGPGYPSLCEDTQAVGIMPDAGPRPRLIFIYETLSGHSDKAVEPFILSWDAEKNRYVLNQAQTDWLSNRNIWDYTIEKVRKTLARYHLGQNDAPTK